MTESEQLETQRRRRPRNSLTLDAILDAAEAVACDGFESLTIRAVATSLESSPMGLYRYFRTKDELVEALLDRVLGRIRLAPAGSDWVEDLRQFARGHRELLLEHPWAIAPLIRTPYPGPNVLPIGEHALAILRRGGVTGERAVALFSGIIALNYGWSSFAAARIASETEDGAPVSLPVPPPGFPETMAAAGAMSGYGSDGHYELALEALLGGIRVGSGKLTPVSASDAAHSRAAASGSDAASERPTSTGGPAISRRPLGPA
jgi:AcrR family transcriptional regulator